MPATIKKTRSGTGEPAVGEIRVKVKITNALDEEMARIGQLARDKVRSYEADAVVDTGAVRSVIPTHVVEKVGISIRGQRVAEYADGRKDTVGISGGVLFDILGRDTIEEALVLGDEILIGKTALNKLDLLTDFANQRVVPNPAHPDQPVSKVK